MPAQPYRRSSPQVRLWRLRWVPPRSSSPTNVLRRQLGMRDRSRLAGSLRIDTPRGESDGDSVGFDASACSCALATHGDMEVMGATEVSADPVGDLLGAKHRAGSTLKTPDGQKAGHDPHALLILLDAALVGTDPAAYPLARMS